MISVLYVDDEETLLDIGRLFLERSGDCSVDIAISARQALELMGKKTYDAIVSDYQMPEMDGIAFLKHIRATSDIPFILFTGKGREEVVIEAINNGADFYLQKGGDPKSQFVELEHKIRQAVKRQHAEHELRDSETRYRELVELLPQTVFEIDRRGMIISVNPVGLKAFGYTVEDLEKGVNAFQVFAPEDHQRLRENIQKILTGEPTGALEYTAQRKDGGTFPVLTYSVPIFRDQTPVGLRGVLVDITDRKQAEETLRDSEALLNTILQSSPIPKFVIDTNHRIISWNRALEEATGIRAEEVLGTTRQWMAFYRQERPCMADLIVDGSIDRIPELYKGKFQKSLLIEGAYEATDFFPHLGRKGMWLHFIAAPIMDSAGTVIGAVETLENITELKEAEEALRDSEKRYRNVVEDQTELICRFRPDGTLTFVNDAYCHYFGLKKDECIGKMHGVMLLPEDASKMKEHLKALTSENPVAGIEHRIIMPSGEERWQRWNDRAIFNESGALVEYQSVGRDTTDRKRAEEALQLVNERLRYLLASTSVAIYTSKTSGDYGATSITDNVLQITGYEPRDFIENSSFWIDHVHSEDKKKILDDLPKIFEKNFHFYEYRFRRKDGKYIWIFDEMRLNKDEGGKPREIIGQWMDITERKRAEEALRENEERYRNLFVSSRDAIMTLEPPSWRFTSGNPSTVQMFMARDEAEFTSKEPWMHSPERQPDGRDSSDKAREMIETAMRNGTHFFEWTHKRLNGEDFPATVLLSRVELAGKVFLQATVRDITERKQAEKALKESENRYRAVFESTGTAMVIIEEDTTVGFANKEFFRLTGYSQDDIDSRKSWTEFVYNEDLEKMIAQHRIRRKRPQDALRQYEFRLITKSGKVRDILLTVDMFPGTRRSIASLIDITDRKRVEGALRESEEKYRTLAETNHDFIVTTDFDGIITYANSAAKKMAGDREIVGVAMKEFMDQDQANRHREMLNARRQGLSETLSYEWQIKSPEDGSSLLLDVRSSLLLERGKPSGVLFNARDITGRKQAEETRRQTLSLLEATLESTADGLLVVNRAGKIVNHNKKFAEMWHIPRDVLATGDDNAAINYILDQLKDPDGFLLKVRTLYDTPTAVSFDTLEFKDGRIFERYSQPQKIGDEIVGRVWSFRDVTEHKQADAALRHNVDEIRTSRQALEESRQMLQSVLDTIPVRVFWKDSDLKYLGCNRPFALDSGFTSPEELIGKSDYEMGWAEQADLYRADDRAVIESGIPKLNYEEPQTTPDGSHIWLRTSKIPLQDTQGTIRGILGTCEDITAIKEAQIKINTLAQFPVQDPNPIMRVDAGGVLRFANPASDRVLAPLGMNVGGPISPEWHQRVKDALASGTIVSFEQTIGGFAYSISIEPFADEGFANLNLLDIKPIKEAERAQKERAERALQYQKALVSLATTDAPTLRDAMNRITETGATILGVERAGIWFFSADGATLFCSDLFIKTRNLHESGQTITGADYPRYFAALQDNRMIVAADARTHEHTSEFASGYLEPQNISSMLHVPIRSGRTVVGVLCFEHTGPARSWDAGDQDFAASVADFAAIVLEKARRRLAEKDLQKSEDRARITQFAVEHAAEGILWLNTAGNVVYANPAYCRMLGYTIVELLKLTIFDIEPTMPREGWSDRQGRKDERGSFTFETHHAKKGGERFPVEVTSDYFTYAGETYICSYVRDISERTREQKALRIANQKLNLLSSVTRHDILNKLTIVLGYLELSKMAHDQEKLEDFIKKIDENISVIQEQIQFTRDYQDMGVKAPEWQDAASVFAKVLSQLDLGTVHVHNDLSGLSLFADPLLERAMYNIVDNALRYGEKVATIRARYLLKDEGLIWIIEDDGVGISAKNKSLIFNKGFGKHTGLGLFLTREILSITGMMIMETGFPGTGARFEIHVPPGGYRFA